MTIENDALCEDLRTWMKSPAMGYRNIRAIPASHWRMLANFNTKFFASGAKTNSGQFYTGAHADKP